MSDASIELNSLLGEDAFVRSVCRSIVGPFGSDDEDARQEAWTKALSAGAGFRPSSLAAWLHVVARNHRRSLRRADRARQERERRTAGPASTPSPAEILEREELRRRVIEAVLELEERYRVVVVRRYLQGEAPPEIAASLGVPVQTVWTRLHRARAILRDRLRADDPSESRGLVALAGMPSASKSIGWAAMSAKGAASVALVSTLLLISFLIVRGTTPPGTPSAPPSTPTAQVDEGAGSSTDAVSSGRYHGGGARGRRALARARGGPASRDRAGPRRRPTR